MARARRRRGRTRGEPGWPLISFVGLIAIGIIAVLVWLYLSATAGHVDRDNIFCPTTGAKSQTLILVDASDTIADLTKTEISQRLADIATSIPVGGRLTIRTLLADTQGSDEIFDLCNPGDGSQLNAATANPERAKELWKKGFEGPLEAALKRATSDAHSNTSPLMAAMQKYAVDRLVSKASQVIPTTLIVISDMFENTPDFSMYRQGADFDAFTPSPAATKYDTNLQGADVELWLIARTKSPADANALADFWTKWTAHANGSVSRVLKLQGVSDG